MFAVIKTGGKQYKVSEGQVISIEKLDSDINSEVIFGEVLMVAENDEKIKIGMPLVSGAKVHATVLDQYKDEKKIVFKFHSKTNYKRKKGHRQPLTCVRITKIAY